TKAERRELQERQRAAKATLAAGSSKASAPGSGGGGGGGAAGAAAGTGGSSTVTTAGSRGAGAAKASTHASDVFRGQSKTVQLFSHLVGYDKGAEAASDVWLSSSEIHPSVALLGQRYASGSVRGANARAIAMLGAFKDVIRDYQTPAGTALSRDLVKHLLPMIQFLIDCRPHSISMGNSIKFVKTAVAHVPPEMSEADAKAKLIDEIDAYERIVISAASIAEAAVQKITDGDVILTYGSSSLVESILTAAIRGGGGGGASFRVIVVDSRPGLEGRRMAQRLSNAGIDCTYVLLNGMAYIMREVTKVFVGASALMANGAALSRVGTALVAMMARSHNIPVLFCCETYKFCERVQLDAIVHNELGHPAELLGSERAFEDAKAVAGLQFLNLRYDLTPIKYVSLVVTEVGFIPPTSVPVLIRELTRKEEKGG
ncbi:unnamed protein product, partial [Phaeothamnion confervicola]